MASILSKVSLLACSCLRLVGFKMIKEIVVEPITIRYYDLLLF